MAYNTLLFSWHLPYLSLIWPLKSTLGWKKQLNTKPDPQIILSIFMHKLYKLPFSKRKPNIYIAGSNAIKEIEHKWIIRLRGYITTAVHYPKTGNFFVYVIHFLFSYKETNYLPFIAFSLKEEKSLSRQHSPSLVSSFAWLTQICHLGVVLFDGALWIFFIIRIDMMYNHQVTILAKSPWARESNDLLGI